MLAEVALAVVLARASCDAPGIPDRYDGAIRAAVERYWPKAAHPWWCWWKAQLWSESQLKADARSPVGAQGVAQVMPATGREVMERIGVRCSLYVPDCGIQVGTAYSGRVMRIFTSPRPMLDLLCHQAAGYNAGPGNVLKAQAVARSEDCDRMLAALPRVTGRHADETRSYVKRVRAVWVRLLAGRKGRPS